MLRSDWRIKAGMASTEPVVRRKNFSVSVAEKFLTKRPIKKARRAGGLRPPPVGVGVQRRHAASSASAPAVVRRPAPRERPSGAVLAADPHHLAGVVKPTESVNRGLVGQARRLGDVGAFDSLCMAL